MAESKKAMKIAKKKKLERLYRDYTIPENINDEYEKNLKIIATKGIIKLFNALRSHQSEIKKNPSSTHANKPEGKKQATAKGGLMEELAET